jgi:hypothetical protein
MYVRIYGCVTLRYRSIHKFMHVCVHLVCETVQTEDGMNVILRMFPAYGNIS